MKIKIITQKAATASTSQTQNEQFHACYKSLINSTVNFEDIFLNYSISTVGLVLVTEFIDAQEARHEVH